MPWAAHLAVTAAALAVLVATGAAALLALAAAALAWAAKTVRALRQERRWSWWILAFPAALAAAAAAASAAAPAFEDALPQFEQAAARLRSAPRAPVGELHLGRFDIDHAVAFHGQVFFTDDRALSSSGWVHSPGGAPHHPGGTLAYRHITGPWYSFDLRLDQQD